MRIERVRIAGIGPFRAEQEVDFTQYASDGLFLIAGKTGSGKSSILDAIVYALYDRLPRYDAGTERTIRSDHAGPRDASWVDVVFELPRGRYRVWRAPEHERPKARGEGTTISKSDARLDVWDDTLPGDDKWVTIAAKPRDVGRELTDLLPLSGDQFLQVVLLAQNRFHEFLVADSADRTKLLRALFSTHRFEQLGDRVEDRRRVAQESLAVAQARVDTHRSRHTGLADELARIESELAGPDAPGDAGADARHAFPPAGTAVPSSESLAHAAADEVQNSANETPASADADSAADAAPELGLAISVTTRRARRAADIARTAAAHADAALEGAEGALTAASALRARQLRREAAARELAELDERRALVEAQRRRLVEARAAAPLMPLVTANDDAERSLNEAMRTALTVAASDPNLVIDPALVPPRALVAAWTNRDAPAGTRTASCDDEARLAEAEPTLSPVHLDATRRIARDIVESASARIGALEPEAARERSRPGIARAAAEATRAVGGARAKVDALSVELAQLPASRADHETARAAHDAIAATVARTESDLTAANAARAAARRAASITDELTTATGERDAARALAVAAAQRNQDLQRTRIDHAAGILADRLDPGSPCQVCGSCVHPQPATARPADDVSDKALKAAVDAEKLANETLAAKERAVEGVDARLHEAKVEAGTRTLDEHDEFVTAAEAAHLRATTAVKLRNAAAAALVEIDARTAELESKNRAANDELVRARLVAERRDAELTALDAALAEARGEHESVAAAVADAVTTRDRARETVASLDRLAEARTARDAARQRLDAQLRDGQGKLGLLRALPDIDHPEWDTTVASLAEVAMSPAAMSQAEAAIREFDDKLAAAAAKLAEPELDGLPEEPADVAHHEASRTRAAADRDAACGRLRDAVRLADDLSRLRTAAAVDVDSLANAQQRHGRLRALSSALRGTGSNELRMSLEAFVLAAQMEEIVESANLRLAAMTSGRYQLEHDDALRKGRGASGLGLRILDAYTGRSRPTRSLSGGETFLASLALALGLRDTVTAQAGGVRLDTLFIDEGFGSLDGDTLDVAMATLDSLRAGGRTVGVISHVDTMHEQIPARLEVRVTESGDSVIEQHGARTSADAGPSELLSGVR